MGAPRKPFDIARATREYNNGASLKEVSEAQDVRPSTAVKRLREAGVVIRNRGGRRQVAVADTVAV